jgi:hypothetical protein
MSDKPRRPWFQIHLSTAIVLMFVAGGLMFANFGARITKPTSNFKMEFGWPCIVWTRFEIRDLLSFEHREDEYRIRVEGGDEIVVPQEDMEHFDSRGISSGPRIKSLAINLATALAILASIAFGCEWHIRRRESRAP